MGMLTGPGVRALLVGTGQHTAGSELPDLPTVSATVTDLATTFVQRCGARPEQVRTLLNPTSPLEFGQELTAAAAQAEDVLLVCYLGHGLLDARGEQLYLATQATNHLRDGLRYTALPYAALHEELANSRAQSVILLLDCCFSGQASFAATRSPGGYLLASAEPNELALAPTGERHTAFTGELIRLLHDGDPAGPPELTLDHLYRCLDRVLSEQGRPRPRRYATGRTGELALAPNPAYRPPMRGTPRVPAPAPEGTDAVCPYRGLAAYDVTDAQYFFGREALTEQLVARLAEQLPGAGMLVVVGPSGSGKSSLLRAGLIPALEAGLPTIPGSQAWPRVVFTPGADPITNLASRLAPVAGEAADALCARLAADPAQLSAVAQTVLSRHARGEHATGRRLVLVVDQFEELFTLCEDPDERRAFLDALSNAAAASTALVVLGLRADFYAQCAAEPQLVEALQHSQLIVTPMNTDELRAAIERPAAQAGLTVQPELVTQMLRDLGADEGEHTGGLPLLSHALRATWQHRDGDLLTLDGYAATGGIWQAVTRTAEDRYAGLSATEQDTAQLVLLRMVHLGEGGTEDTRRRVRLADLPDTEATNRVLTTFADARLITLSTETAEITHEALLRAWPRLRQWIDTDRAGNLIRQQLEDAAAVWDRDGRDPAGLYRGGRLEAARTWAASTSHEGDLSPAASAFLAASTAQKRRTVRLRRVVLVVLSVLALVASGAAVVAFQQRTAAQSAYNTAVFNRVTAEADQLRGTDVSLAAQLDLTAYRMRPEPPDLYTALVTAGDAVLSTPLIGHTSDVRVVTFSPDGHTLATCSYDQTARLWNVTDPTHPVPLGSPLTGHTGQVISMAFSPDGHTLASGSTDHTVRLWNVIDPAHPTVLGQPLTDHSGHINGVAFSPDGRTLATGSDDSTVRLWNMTDPARPTVLGLINHTSWVGAVAFSPDGRTLATGSGDYTVRLWNVTDLTHPAPLGQPLTGHTSWINVVAFSPDGHTLASGSFGQTVRLWNVTDPTHPAPLGQPLTGSANWVAAVAFSPDGRTLATGSANGTVRLWNVTDPARPTPLGAPLAGHTSWINGVAFSPDGRTLASGSTDHTARLWNIPAALITGHTDTVNAVAFSPDGRTLATGSWDQTVRLWNVTDPTHPTPLGQPLTGHTNVVKVVAFSPDGRTLASGSWDRMVRLWNVADPTHPTPLGQPLTGHTDSVFAVAFSPDGHTLASSGGDDRTVRLWNVTDPTHPTPLGLIGYTNSVGAMALSPDGHTLATGSGDGTVRLWNVADPTHPTPLGQPLTGHNNYVGAVAFSPDGRTLASSDYDQTVRLWNVADPTHPTSFGQPLTGHTDSVFAVAFSPDGHTLATGSNDHTVRLWNVTDPTHPTSFGQPLTGHTDSVFAVAFSPDGRTLASGSADRTVRLWGMNVEQAIQRICATTANTLTPAKWDQYVSPDLPYHPPCP